MATMNPPYQFRHPGFCRSAYETRRSLGNHTATEKRFEAGLEMRYRTRMIAFLITFYRLVRGVVTAFKDPEFEVLVTLAAITLASGTLFYHGFEGWGWLDSLYFSVTTLTTVGYGDFYPHSQIGKIFTIVYIFVGVGVLLGFINALAHHTVKQGAEEGLLPWRTKNKKSL